MCKVENIRRHTSHIQSPVGRSNTYLLFKILSGEEFLGRSEYDPATRKYTIFDPVSIKNMPTQQGIQSLIMGVYTGNPEVQSITLREDALIGDPIEPCVEMLNMYLKKNSNIQVSQSMPPGGHSH